MEGGNPILEWITYGMIGLVLLSVALLALRSAWFILSLLLIPVTGALGRTRLFGRAVRRWGERGAGGAGGLRTLGPSDEEAIAAAVAARPVVPAVVRRAMVVGAVLGALPGVWMAVDGVRHDLARGEPTAAIAGTVAMALALVSAAGVFVGGAVGALVGLALDAAAERRQR